MSSPAPTTKLLLAQALELDNLYLAWDEVRQNRGSAGGDRITLARFERRLEINLLGLADRVQTGQYRPGKVRLVTIWTGSKRREIAIWCVADRVLQRAVLHVLEPIFEREFLPSSFGYRPGRSVSGAVQQVLQLRDQGHTWVVDADIKDCFLRLDHGLLMEWLGGEVMDQDLLDLVSTWLPQGRPRSVRRAGEARGISLGGVISPLLCNIYLHRMDQGLARARLQLVRYADDFVVLCQARWERDQALGFITAILDEIRLEVNPTKTRLTTFDEGFTFLGVAFEEHRYRYLWRDISVEARDQGQTFPLDLDGYWWM